MRPHELKWNGLPKRDTISCYDRVASSRVCCHDEGWVPSHCSLFMGISHRDISSGPLALVVLVRRELNHSFSG